MRALCYGESTGVCLWFMLRFRRVFWVLALDRAVFGILAGTFVGFLALVLILSRQENGVKPKPISDRHFERRMEGRAEDVQLIMRPAFLVALGFGASVRAGRSQRCASVRRSRGMVRSMSGVLALHLTIGLVPPI